MDAKLRSLYNYDAVDKECKANDFMIYKTFFRSQYGDTKLQKMLGEAYQGFNHSDWQKVSAWAHAVKKWHPEA